MTYEAYLAGEPLVITAPLTGGVQGKEANPNLPETPEEIGRAAAEAEEAGAAVVHLHAREPNGERAFSVDRFQEVTDAVRARTEDVVVNHSTGGTAAPLEARRQPLRTDPPPDVASLDMGPLNRYQHLTSENTRGTVDALFDEMVERGIRPEYELFNDGHRNELFGLLERRDVPAPRFATLVFGPGTLTRPSPRNVLTAVEDLPPDTLFNVLGFGRHQLPLTTLGILLGGHVRVGMEDNLYYREGEPAESSAQLVARTARIARSMEREVATPAQAREILGLE